MVILLIAVVAIIIVLAMKKGKNQEIPLKVEEEPKKLPEKDNPASKVIISKGLKEEKKDVKKEDGQEVAVIYEDEKDSHLWICPNCETENLPSREICCVCYAKK